MRYLIIGLCMVLRFTPVLTVRAAGTGDPDTSKVFTSIEEALKNPLAVYHLNLSRKKLTAIPAEVFQLINLRTLILEKNRITEIPNAISSLSHLRELNVARNKLTEIPVALCEITSLTKLILNQNQIERIPPAIKGLINLEYLDMWSNELYEIPDEIAHLKKLKEFDLRVIQFSPTEQIRIKKLLPNTLIRFSNSCNCG